MNLLPVVQRELTQAARKPSTFGIRISAAVLGFVIAGVALVVASNAGRQLFSILTTLSFVAAAAAGVFLTADSLRSEKREGTLGLLFLTDLRGYDIVLGKLASSSLSTFLALFALFPVFSLSWLLGGVTGEEFWRTCLSLVVTLVFSLSIGLAFSAQGKKHGEGMFISAATLLIFTVVWPLLSAWVATSTRFALLSRFFDANPWSCFQAATDTGLKVSPTHFWNCFWGTASWSILATAFASWVLPRRFLDEVRSPGGWWTELQNLERRATGGSRTLVPRLLDRNPIAAMQARAPMISLLSWSVAVLATSGGILQAVYFGAGGASVRRGLIATPAYAMIGLGCLLLLLAWQACGFFREAKVSGLLELLATTPLTDRNILNGQWIALLRIFLGPFLLIFASGCVTSLIGSTANGGTLPNQGADVLLWVLLLGETMLNCLVAAWAGAWYSLNDDRRQLSFLKTVALLALPKLLICCPIAEPFVMLGLFFYLRSRFVMGIRRILIGPRQMGERSWQPMIQD